MELFDAVKNEEKRLDDLYKRMDADMKIYYLEKFTLMMEDGNKKVPHADSVTLNDPRTYADRVVSVLGSAKRRFDVSGEAHVQKSIEKFLNVLFPMNDDVLALQMTEDLEFHFDFFAALRGWVAARALILKGGSVVTPEIVPLDPRWCVWQAGRNGLEFGAYKVTMSPAAVEAQYGKAMESKSKDLVVRCAWSKEDYQVCIEGKESELLVNAHPNLGHCPIVVVPAPTHPSMIINEKEGIKYRGESIYAANRDVYPKLNELASVWATLNKMSFMAPIGFVSDSDERALQERPYGIGVVVNLHDNEKFVEIPTKDVQASQQNLFGALMAGMQRGSLPNVDYGELGFELSAVAISKLTESRNVVFQPRLKAKSRAMSQIAGKCIKQFTGDGYETELGEEALNLIFTESLDGPFQIRVNYHSVSPEQNVANYTIAQAAKVTGLSDETIFRDVLELEDPKGEITRREAENAEKEVPELRLYRYAVSLLEQYEETKDETLQVSAQLIARQLGMSIEGGKIVGAEGEEGPAKEASQPKPGVKMPGMPSVTGEHIVRETARRKGIEQQEAGEKSR